MTPGLPIFDYQAMPAHRNDDCSEAAAKKIKPSVREMETSIAMVLARRDMTCEEVAAETGIDLGTVRPRLSEMKKRNVVEMTGAKGLSKQGGKSNKWRLKR